MESNLFYSQQEEDKMLYEKYLNYRNGFFIELGAMDGITFSNTKFFEDTLNWKGILIEPTQQYNNLIINRPNCYNFNYAVSEKNGDVDFLGYAAIGGLLNTMSEEHIKSWNLKDVETFKVESKPLHEIIRNIDINKIDLFSIDVEGGEYEVLSTFNWNIPVYVVLIEMDGRNKDKDERCRNLLMDKGFIFDMRIGLDEVWINKYYMGTEIPGGIKYLLSYPRSGNSLVRYCVEKITKRSTIDCNGKRDCLTDETEYPILRKEHYVKYIQSDINGLILLIRDYKDVYFSNMLRSETPNLKTFDFNFENFLSNYYELIDYYDSYNNNKIFFYYEDLINNTKDVIKKIINFLVDKDIPFDDEDLKKWIAEEKNQYGGKAGIKTPEIKTVRDSLVGENHIDDVFRRYNTYLYDKYLSKYNNIL